jgi:hypothetical protein
MGGKTKELFLGVVIFFTVERIAILISSHAVESTQDILVARKRALIELMVLVAALLVTLKVLKA